MVRLICAQPAILYYAWQVEVMLNNFKNVGINLNHVDIVCAIQTGTDMSLWGKLAEAYPARFFFYRDDRPSPVSYTSSVRPWVLAKHWKAHPYLENETVFYHDCDIVFSKPVDFERFEKSEHCHGSDVRWYISHRYIIGKGEDVLNRMCEIVDISPKVIEDNELNCIGAQYVLKGITHEFWTNVFNHSEQLFKDITALNITKKKESPSYHELQIWCADMWALLWNLWKEGKQTIPDSELAFSWATSTEQDWYNHSIFHNAGVTGPDTGLFFKGSYIHKLPYNENLSINPGTASAKYYELINSFKSVLC